MKQKHIVPIVLLVLVFGCLVACGTSEPLSPSAEIKPTKDSTPKPTGTPVEPADRPTVSKRVPIRWFVGLGAGTDMDAYEVQQAIVDEFNASQDEIELILEVNMMGLAYDNLESMLARGEVFDIIGPVGIRGRDTFKGQWLDLQPLIEASGYDLSDYDPAMVTFYQVKGEGQLGLPFLVFPSFVFVNKDLFDKANLPYPPQEYGAPYIDENGEEKPWNTDTLRELAMKLTLDADGNNPTNPSFDPENIIQFGYLEQYTDMRGALTLFGPGSFVADDGKMVQMPEHWREGAHWIYDAMWTDHFWPTDDYINSDILLDGNPFQSGHLAMSHVHLWFAAEWALEDIDFAWDTAVVPAYKGQVTAKMHADTFGILKVSKHPREAFEVLTYLFSEEVSPELLKLYGGMPARIGQQEEFLETYGETVFPGQEINWQVVQNSIHYADNPNHESWMPSFQETNDTYNKTWTRLAQEPDLDVDAELDALVERLQKIFDAAKE